MLTRITPDGCAHAPVRVSDGTRMAYTGENATTDAEDIFVQPIDRSAPPVAILNIPSDQHARAWPNDTTIVFSNNNAARTLGGTLNGGSADMVNLLTKAKPKPLLHAAWGESDAPISPDGQWMAFTSTESGTPEIHVRAFPDGASRGDWKISTGGGQKARWSPTGARFTIRTPTPPRSARRR